MTRRRRVNIRVHYGGAVEDCRGFIPADLLRRNRVPPRSVQKERRLGHLPTGSHPFGLNVAPEGNVLLHRAEKAWGQEGEGTVICLCSY